MRTCRICGVSKDESEFKASKKHKDGRKTRCIACGKLKNQLRHAKEKAAKETSKEEV